MPAPSFRIVAASFGHIPNLAAHIRARDAAEILASSGQNPAQALEQSLALSTRAWCALLNGRPAVMWGVGAGRGLLSSTGTPWLLATNSLYALARPFLRLSRRYTAIMHEDFPTLENYTHADNRAALRWLAWCGFNIADRPAPYGPFGEPFYRFWRTQCATSPKHSP